MEPATACRPITVRAAVSIMGRLRPGLPFIGAAMRVLPHALRLGHSPNCRAESGLDDQVFRPIAALLAGAVAIGVNTTVLAGAHALGLKTANGGRLRLLEDVADGIAVWLGLAAW
jgi:hypothetical protein